MSSMGCVWIFSEIAHYKKTISLLPDLWPFHKKPNSLFWKKWLLSRGFLLYCDRGYLNVVNIGLKFGVKPLPGMYPTKGILKLPPFSRIQAPGPIKEKVLSFLKHI